MKSLARIAAVLTLAAPALVFAESAEKLTDRDQLVLAQALTHLLRSDESNLTEFEPVGTQLLLVSRTPEQTGFLQPLQLKTDLRDQTLPRTILEDLRTRNTARRAMPRSLAALDASFKRCKPPEGVVVVELPNELRGLRGIRDLERLHPAARCWVQCYLPGYSGDGNQAIVRALVGPTRRRGSVTLLLKQEKDDWVVQWQLLTRYH